ncbi:MAG TPA: hypothetical protein VFX65_01130 [Candidatus Limnocylindrales bacterium]|nr:hypothetical protein [Candidatus Limnocylindrales bacterium]
MALVMVKFQDGPLRGVTLPVDHNATEYRHLVREPAPGAGTQARVYVYRRTGRTTFALDHEEDGGFA